MCRLIIVCGLLTLLAAPLGETTAAETACLTGDCQNGRGTFIFYSLGMWYQGQFRDGRFDGLGTLTLPGGGTKTGLFREGVWQGPAPEPETPSTKSGAGSTSSANSASPQKAASTAPSPNQKTIAPQGPSQSTMEQLKSGIDSLHTPMGPNDLRNRMPGN